MKKVHDKTKLKGWLPYFQREKKGFKRRNLNVQNKGSGSSISLLLIKKRKVGKQMSDDLWEEREQERNYKAFVEKFRWAMNQKAMRTAVCRLDFQAKTWIGNWNFIHSNMPTANEKEKRRKKERSFVKRDFGQYLYHTMKWHHCSRTLHPCGDRLLFCQTS